MKGKMKIEIRGSEMEISALYAALKKEEEKTERFKVSLSKSNGCLIIKIEGNDAVALRSTANTFLRYLQIIESINEVIE